MRHLGTSSHSNYTEVCEAAIKDGFYEVLMPVVNICTEPARPPPITCTASTIILPVDTKCRSGPPRLPRKPAS